MVEVLRVMVRWYFFWTPLSLACLLSRLGCSDTEDGRNPAPVRQFDNFLKPSFALPGENRKPPGRLPRCKVF